MIPKPILEAIGNFNDRDKIRLFLQLKEEVDEMKVEDGGRVSRLVYAILHPEANIQCNMRYAAKKKLKKQEEMLDANPPK